MQLQKRRLDMREWGSQGQDRPSLPDPEVGEIVVCLWLVQPLVEILPMLALEQNGFTPFVREPEPGEIWKANEDEEKEWDDEVVEQEDSDDEEGHDDGEKAHNPDGYWRDRLSAKGHAS